MLSRSLKAGGPESLPLLGLSGGTLPASSSLRWWPVVRASLSLRLQPSRPRLCGTRLSLRVCVRVSFF